MRPQIRLANHYRDFSACRRFWYDIYVTEMGRHRGVEPGVDHELGELSDPNERTADLFMATVGDRVVGTLKSAYCRSSDLRNYESLYGLSHRSREDLESVSVTSKLMIAADYRATGLPFKLAIATYYKGLADGITENYIDTNGHLIDFYKRIGYREHLGWIEHEDYGRVYSMVFELTNKTQLRRTRSPLLKHLEQYEHIADQQGERHNEQVA